MMTFRKISAASVGKLIAAYFTEGAPDPTHDFRTDQGRVLDSGDRLTSYYLGRDGRAAWRPDLSQAVADALGVGRRSMPMNEDLARLFEAKRADTGEAWSKHKREISAYDLTMAPHKSVTLAAEFAPTDAERAAIWHAIVRANDETMRYVAKEIGWARKGHGGEDGADPGQVGWVSFRHHAARPTLHMEDTPSGITYLLEGETGADPQAHIHNALFNVVVTEDGRVGSLDTKRLHSRVHEFGAYFQARLADHLRKLGVEIGYDEHEAAVVATAVPQHASDHFSRRTADVTRAAKAYAVAQGHDWDELTIEHKNRMLKAATLATRLKKNEAANDEEAWRDRAEAIGWHHGSVLGAVRHERGSDRERLDAAYRFAARHLGHEFETAAVVDHDKLRTYAARGLIGTGIGPGPKDIDRVVDLLERRGLEVRGEHVALVTGRAGDKLRVTNTAQVRIEQSLAAQARAAAVDRSSALLSEALEAAIARSRLDFASEHGRAQLAAIRAIGLGGKLSLLTGVAGAGKTAILEPLVDAWKQDRRRVVGAATAWRQADALKDAGIDETSALAPLLDRIAKGDLSVDQNTVLVIDEVSQVAPRQMLALLDLQARTGLTIKLLGDREQAPSIEAGDTIEILNRVLPKEDMPELLSTVRQTTRRNREIAGLFRGQEPEIDELAALDPKGRSRRIQGPHKVAENVGSGDDYEIRKEFHLQEVRRALEMKREDGTALLVGGDHDQVLGRIADLYITRRDALLASGASRGITISALTNQDAADISRAVRERLKARGEIDADERTIQAVDQRGERFEMQLAAGDRVRLYGRTFGKDTNGRAAFVGSNGDIVEVTGHSDAGIGLRSKKDGREILVAWSQLQDARSGRTRLGWGHAMTIDAAQGITSDEHINALPRGMGRMTGFTGYVAESRARGTTWTMISEASVFEAVRQRKAIGDITPVSTEELWTHVATAMAAKPYKALGMDLARAAQHDQERAVERLIRVGHLQESLAATGRDRGRELRMRVQAELVRKQIPKHIEALDAAIAGGLHERAALASSREAHLRDARVEADRARRAIEAAFRRSGPRPTP